MVGTFVRTSVGAFIDAFVGVFVGTYFSSATHLFSFFRTKQLDFLAVGIRLDFLATTPSLGTHVVQSVSSFPLQRKPKSFYSVLGACYTLQLLKLCFIHLYI